jgi:hypothetical protein
MTDKLPLYRVPIAIDVVSHRLSLTIEFATLGVKVAGMLVGEGDRGSVAYKPTYALFRQKCTISHEIAH